MLCIAALFVHAGMKMKKMLRYAKLWKELPSYFCLIVGLLKRLMKILAKLINIDYVGIRV